MMDPLIIAVIAGVGVFLAVWAGCLGLEKTLRNRNILDRPNSRSNHATPTPRGGGVAVMTGWLAGVAVLNFTPAGDILPFGIIWLFLALAVLMAVSWIDDLYGVRPGPRFFIHILAALIALPSLPGPVFESIPPWLNVAVVCLLWVWFANLYNFMDGIDGLSAIECLSICGGVTAVALIIPQIAPLSVPVILLGAAMAGFLIRNWPPARIFLGDVGSVPVGFVLAWMLLWLAVEGQPEAALILPLYYLADSGLTLIRRLMRGARVWEAHSEHAYQQAVRRGLSHTQVTGQIGLANIALIAFALFALNDAIAPVALIGAVLCVVLLLYHLYGEQPVDAADRQSRS